MAVVVTDAVTGATQASLVDVKTGTVAPAPSASGGFGSTPRVRHAAFHPASDELWYVDPGNDQVASYDPPSGRTTVRGPAPGGTDEVALGASAFWPLYGTEEVVVAPDGKHVVVRELDWTISLVPAGGTVDDAPVLGDSSIRDSIPGPSVECRQPQVWLDDQNLLCLAGGIIQSFTLVTFAPGRGAITGGRDDLLPETNRMNFSPVPSPDGKSFAFLSQQGQQVTLFRQALTPGSTPAKVADIEPPTPADEETLVPVPYLLAWQ